MIKLIKQMRDILGDHYTNQIHIHILSDEIYFGVYENEIPIVVNLKNKEVYVDCEGMIHHLNWEMLDKLFSICWLLESNLEMLEDLLEWN